MRDLSAADWLRIFPNSEMTQHQRSFPMADFDVSGPDPQPVSEPGEGEPETDDGTTEAEEDEGEPA